MKTIFALLLLTFSALAADFTITFTIPDNRAQAVIDDLAEARGYPITIPDPVRPQSGFTIPNPQSKVDFLKADFGRELIGQLIDVRARKAALVALESSKAATVEAAKAVSIK